MLIRIYVEDPEARLADFDEIRIWRDTSPTGAFTTVVADIALASGQTLYTFDDLTGAPDSWYRYAFRNAATITQSEFSSPFKARGGTLSSLTFLVAQRASAAFEGVTSGASGATTLVDDALRDFGHDQEFLNGAWVSVGGTVRRTTLAPFDPSTGAVSLTREWTPPAPGSHYRVFAILPPEQTPGAAYSWAQAVRDGLRYCWFVDQIIVGHGDGQTSRFPLTAVQSLNAVNRRRAVFLRYNSGGRQYDRDLGRGASYWSIEDDDTGPVLVLPFAPPTGSQVVVEVARQPDTPWQPDDYVDFPEDVAVRAGVLAAYRHLNAAPGTRGNYTTELAGAISEFMAAYAPIQPQDAILQR